MLAYTSEKIIRGIYSTRIIVDGDEESKIAEGELNLVMERLKTFLEDTKGHFSRFSTVILHECYTNTHVSIRSKENI